MPPAVLLTSNFQIEYDPAEYPDPGELAGVQARAQAFATGCEPDYAALCGWFGVAVGQGFGASNRVTVTLTKNVGGAVNWGYSSSGPRMLVNPELGSSDGFALGLFVAEMSEILMSYTGLWHPGYSDGEGLSRLAAQLLHPDYPNGLVNAWLAADPTTDPSSAVADSEFRQDWVSRNFTGGPLKAGGTVRGDEDSYSYGCAMLFIYYLKSQLGFSMPQIVQRAGATLGETYQALTNTQSTNGFGEFKSLLAQHFPVGVKSPADDPFPLAAIPGFTDHLYTTSAAERDQAVQSYGYQIDSVASYVLATQQNGTVPLHRLVKDTHFYTTSDAERDNAINNLGYVSEGEACFVYDAPTGTVPFYRLVNIGHFYTTSLQERDNAMAAYGYHPEDIACHVFGAPRDGTAEFYRLVKGDDHFYTTSAAERDDAVSVYGYQSEGTACNVFASQQPGTVPLHRLVKDTHLYTTSDAERDNAITNLGYTSEGEACYVFDAPTGTVPLYRLVKTDHFYTTALSERDQFIAVFGYQSENVACHVFESSTDNALPFFRLALIFHG